MSVISCRLWTYKSSCINIYSYKIYISCSVQHVLSLEICRFSSAGFHIKLKARWASGWPKFQKMHSTCFFKTYFGVGGGRGHAPPKEIHSPKPSQRTVQCKCQIIMHGQALENETPMSWSTPLSCLIFHTKIPLWHCFSFLIFSL